MRNQLTMLFPLSLVLLNMLQFKMLLISFSTLVQIATWQSQILSQLSDLFQFQQMTIIGWGFLSTNVILAQGCSSSCQIFEAFANVLEWILCNKFGVRYCLHVVDEFCFVAPTLFECQQYLNAWISLCSVLGVPLAGEKACNPSQVMIFLGIELSTVKMMAQLPVDKLRRQSDIISDASKSRKVKLCEMQSIIGCLQLATSVIVPGKAFICWLINRTLGVSVPFHYVTLNEETKKDLNMWQKFLRFHNGKTIFISQTLTSGDIQLYTDASKLACSAIFDKQWFVVKLPIQWQYCFF